MSIYIHAIKKLLEASQQYKRKEIGLEEYQNIVWGTAEVIVLVDEKDLRCFLQNSEGDLELIRFTVNSNKIFDESLKIVQQIEERALKELPT